MSTPRTKPLKRWKPPSYNDLTFATFYAGDLPQDYQQVIGKIASNWPHIEEAMIEVLGVLMGSEWHLSPARQVFRSVVNARDRIKVMRSLLEEARINQHRGPEFDAVIDEFASLNTSRNQYVHGLFWTRHDGKIVLQEASTTDHGMIFSKHREVALSELKAVATRMDKLYRRAVKLASAESKPSPETHPEQDA